MISKPKYSFINHCIKITIFIAITRTILSNISSFQCHDDDHLCEERQWARGYEVDIVSADWVIKIK